MYKKFSCDIAQLLATPTHSLSQVLNLPIFGHKDSKQVENILVY